MLPQAHAAAHGSPVPAAGLRACLNPLTNLPQGYGDPERDYQLLAQQAADEAAAADDGQPLGGSAAKRAKLGTAAVAQVCGVAGGAALLRVFVCVT